MDDIPSRIEDVEPALAELLKQVANGEHPTVKSLYFSLTGLRVVRKPVRVEQKVGRNDPCSCGSGKKFKKCCGV